MRKILLLALLLCKSSTVNTIHFKRQHDGKDENYIADNIVALAIRSNNYDYDEQDSIKRHLLKEDRRNWRKKALSKPSELEHKTWDERRRRDYDSPRYLEDPDLKMYGGREMDPSSSYRFHRRYDEPDKMSPRSGEMGHVSSNPMHKEVDKKGNPTMNCNSPHERYETCFAGCASISCDNPRDRLRPCYPFCEAGCICIHPYVRDDRTHKCVLADECTKGLKGIPDLGEEI